MYEFESRIRYSEVDKEGMLTVPALLDYFQDASVFQSEDIGLGVTYLAKEDMAWILASWQIQIIRMPRLYEEVRIQTWPYDFKSFFGYRNFAIRSKEGELLACADSVWVLMDIKAGRPRRAPEVMLEKYTMEESLPMAKAGRKMAVAKEYEEQAPIQVPNYFIDTNGHMNNGKYILAAMGFVPEEFEVEEIRAEYKKSAFCNEMIYPRITKEEGKVLVNLAAEDGSTYAAIEFIERGKKCV